MYSYCPVGRFAYMVQAGDTVSSIADAFRIPEEMILQNNPGLNPKGLCPGQIIFMPAGMQPVPCPYGQGVSQEALGYFLYPPTPEANMAADPVPEQGPPSGPPPNYIPPEPAVAPFAVDPGAIRFCLNKFTFLWLKNRQSFWVFLVFVGRNSAAGWRFQRGRWRFFGVDLDEIRSFTC